MVVGRQPKIEEWSPHTEPDQHRFLLNLAALKDDYLAFSVDDKTVSAICSRARLNQVRAKPFDTAEQKP